MDYGAKTDEARAFHYAVYETIQKIPRGSVTSYGHIAYLIGMPENSRRVGYALKHLPSNPECEFNHDNVPWWRVINSQGKISLVAEAKQRQMDRLRAENITVYDSGAVPFDDFGWFPDELD